MTAPQVLPEKTLFDVLRDVWRGKFYMLGFAFVTCMFAFIFLVFAQDFYRADMIVAPASPLGHGMQAGAFVGEGSLQVQQEDLQSSAAFLRFEAIFNGVSVASVLLRDEKILAALRFDQSFTFSQPEEEAWSASRFSEYLKRRVRIEPVSGTPLRRMIYLHPDRDFASYMLARVHRVSDGLVRHHILQEVNGRIAYLNKSLVATTNPGHKRNLTALLMEQERLKMMVSLDQPYAATIIEPPFVSSRPRWPDPYIIYPVFLFVGLFLGFVVYGARHRG